MRKPWWFLALLVVCPGSSPCADGDQADVGKSYQIPYRLTATQHVLIRAKINGQGPFNFIIDTGAPALFVSTALAKKLGVEPDKNLWGTFDRFEIEGGLVIETARGRIETPFQLEGMNGLGLAGAEIHGILGYNLLARYRLEFDFTRDKMTWTRLNFNPPPPAGLSGKSGSAGGLDTLGSLMKFAGQVMGKKPAPVTQPRGFMGIELGDVDGGVEITAVLADSPAAKAGLKVGDRLARFQGQAIQSSNQIVRVAATLTAGQTARFQVSRQNNVQEITVKLGEGL